ncbi:MAG: T9SS type A sorting domain-containing protein, partial [Aliifodinibius sp.]|nr:T9SS type A sorting domain-containing protein [Fodinibius sp.]NIV12019.1 T9SS type A sorting domain-containing protein [Fodinibius sp.]NIY25665.1 T9SS type A sorting domain-containing protein [Fodinibius sp.]
PFNPITHIGYRLPKTSDVTVDVIDLSGRRIITLLDTRKSDGYHTIDFDGSRLASGVYLYRIRVGNIMQV